LRFSRKSWQTTYSHADDEKNIRSRSLLVRNENLGITIAISEIFFAGKERMMATLSMRRIDPALVMQVRSKCATELEHLCRSLPDAKAAAVSTGDGRAFSAQFAERGDDARTSALISSLLALCETVSKELNAGHCKSVVIAAEQMNIVVVRIGDTRAQFVLALAVDQATLLAIVLRSAIDLAERLKKILAVLN
jgi:predicted regulator of Ras-like GTPase activity (Roadblock/LC7/MglB family)